MQGKYKVITLCGSTRFKAAFMEAQKRLTLAGNIVISVGLFGHSGDKEVWEGMDEDTLTQTKIMLDDMHKRKIDMADEIYVINVDGYIGESTKSEIEYAQAQNKPVRYLCDDTSCISKCQEKNHIAVESLSISKRICNALKRNDVNYLEQLENYPEEKLIKFRTMGHSSMLELEKIANQYGIHIYSRKDLEDKEHEIYFMPTEYEKIFYSGIKTREDVVEMDVVQLAGVFGKNTAIYRKLKQIQKIEREKRG